MRIPILFLVAFLCLWSLPAQDLAGNLLVADNDLKYTYTESTSGPGSQVNLVDALKALEKQHRVYFTYSNELVNDQKVTSPRGASLSLEEKLERMLPFTSCRAVARCTGFSTRRRSALPGVTWRCSGCLTKTTRHVRAMPAKLFSSTSGPAKSR